MAWEVLCRHPVGAAHHAHVLKRLLLTASGRRCPHVHLLLCTAAGHQHTTSSTTPTVCCYQWYAVCGTVESVITDVSGQWSQWSLVSSTLSTTQTPGHHTAAHHQQHHTYGVLLPVVWVGGWV